jgi:hypothetical protein
MPTENSSALVAHLRKMQELLNTALTLAGADAGNTEKARPQGRKKLTQKIAEIDFSLPARAFFSQHARLMSGPEKFALVVAYLSKGDETKQISIDEVEAHWSKMTSSLGAFNYAHPTRAKDRDLVDSPGKGMYQLRPNWRSILQ